MTHSNLKQDVRKAAANIFAVLPYEKVSLSDIARGAGVSEETARSAYSSVSAVARDILDVEGQTMRDAQAQARRTEDRPIERLRCVVALVGSHIQTIPEVRAGLHLAARSSEHFPERHIDPRRTWRGFIEEQLQIAYQQGSVSTQIKVSRVADLIFLALLGAKEIAEMTQDCDNISVKMSTCLDSILEIITDSGTNTTI
ncbi:TetR/AcrR family transcriptional regulator [Propioniciclava flava]|uniref:TetR/AcrR family transcriptional regulator n=1 Tax=Propioniciclava flava TaxID=2072026 RepID=UPI001012CD71|nr:TetR/AcrR family transcriptional regulator [Propioniciclava flava]